MNTRTLALSLAIGVTPVVAILGTGLDATMLPEGTRVIAARSFVGGDPWTDAAGSGTAAAQAVVDGWEGEVQVLVAQVVGEGPPRAEALARALRWVRTVTVDLNGRAANPPSGLARSLAEQGVVLVTLG